MEPISIASGWPFLCRVPTPPSPFKMTHLESYERLTASGKCSHVAMAKPVEFQRDRGVKIYVVADSCCDREQDDGVECDKGHDGRRLYVVVTRSLELEER